MLGKYHQSFIKIFMYLISTHCMQLSEYHLTHHKYSKSHTVEHKN